MKQLTLLFLLSTNFIYAQINATDMTVNYGKIIKLEMNKEVHFEDSLSIVLTSFSHKRPVSGGSTKATAYLTLSKNNSKNEIMLSVHGIDGKTEAEDGLSAFSRYSTVDWKEYRLELKSFNYDESIELVVLKK